MIGAVGDQRPKKKKELKAEAKRNQPGALNVVLINDGRSKVAWHKEPEHWVKKRTKKLKVGQIRKARSGEGDDATRHHAQLNRKPTQGMEE